MAVYTPPVSAPPQVDKWAVFCYDIYLVSRSPKGVSTMSERPKWLVDPTPDSEKFAMQAYLDPLSRYYDRVEAFAVLPGLDEPRVPAAIRLWQSRGIVARHLLVPGGNTNEERQ